MPYHLDIDSSTQTRCEGWNLYFCTLFWPLTWLSTSMHLYWSGELFLCLVIGGLEYHWHDNISLKLSPAIPIFLKAWSVMYLQPVSNHKSFLLPVWNLVQSFITFWNLIPSPNDMTVLPILENPNFLPRRTSPCCSCNTHQDIYPIVIYILDTLDISVLQICP